MSREEFARLLQTLYAPAGGWEAYITIGDDRAWFVTDSTRAGATFELRFATSKRLPRVTSGFWRTRAQVREARAGLPPAPGLPLDGVRIALDSGTPRGRLGAHGGALVPNRRRANRSRRGEMTLAVAKMIAPRLEALGATVMWVRRENGPVTITRPEGLGRHRRGSALLERRRDRDSGHLREPGRSEREKSIQWEAERLFYRISENPNSGAAGQRRAAA